MRTLTSTFAVVVSALLAPVSTSFSFTLVWPTPNPAFAEGQPISAFIQPTSDGGDPTSGTFGGVRNDGYRFHEGIDIKPVMPRTRRGEATDPVYVAMDGVVASVSFVAGKSNYGRYIVVMHNMSGVKFYTLYAHLAAVDDDIRPGVVVSAGTTLGTMGRSGAGSISKARAHCHFEIGLKFGDSFQEWYKRQKFGSPNFHGNFNGMNLEGFDPMAFYTDYKAGKVTDMAAYIKSLPAAYMLRVNIADVPLIARESPGLLERPIPDKGLVGWDITFTWYGMPTSLKPLTSSDLSANDAPGFVRLRAVNRALLAQNLSRDTVKMKNDKPVVYSGAFDILEMIFGRRISNKAK